MPVRGRQPVAEPRPYLEPVRGAVAVDRTDGLSVELADWRFNLRSSNTEPLLRLNVESRGDAGLMRAKTAELLALLGGEPG